LASPSKEEGYVHLDEIDWTLGQLKTGILIKPKNELDDQLTMQVAKNANGVRWQIEKFHREIKQLTGSEKCQCRKARSQRNHLACCYHAWISLKVKAKSLQTTLYQIRNNLFSDYLRAELNNPRIIAYSGL